MRGMAGGTRAGVGVAAAVVDAAPPLADDTAPAGMLPAPLVAPPGGLVCASDGDHRTEVTRGSGFRVSAAAVGAGDEAPAVPRGGERALPTFAARSCSRAVSRLVRHVVRNSASCCLRAVRSSSASSPTSSRSISTGIACTAAFRLVSRMNTSSRARDTPVRRPACSSASSDRSMAVSPVVLPRGTSANTRA